MIDGFFDASSIAEHLSLESALEALSEAGARYVDHWQQGEFHHDHLFVRDAPQTGDTEYVVLSTNCNGGVKEVVVFSDRPDRWALWKWRCPENEEFEGQVPPILGRATTVHFFDPRELLRDDARSELRPEFRTRERGGGWRPI